jgi:hypothetical protein
MRIRLFIFAAAAGAIVGAAVMRSVDHRAPPTATPAIPSVGETAPAESVGPATESRSTTADRAELYRVAANADADALAGLIAAAARQPPGPARTFTLNVLLTRYAELDPSAAVEAAANLDVELRAPLYAAWAIKDPAAALNALAKIQDRAAARAIAAALVAALGADERALREVAGAVPFGLESSVYADAITERAATDPAAAFTQALQLTDVAARAQALEGVARSWAKLDPQAALAAASNVADPSLRLPFLANIARSWAELDPDSVLAYLTSLDRASRPDLFMAVGGALAQLRPREVLTLAASVDATPQTLSLRMTAIQALVNQDPELALRTAEALPAGMQRESALALVARNYGARDADAALAWARASGDQNRLVAVLQGIAQRDPGRAIDLAVALEPEPVRMQALRSIVLGGGALSGGGAALADRVLALPDAGLRSSVLRPLLSMWSATAPDAAMDWLIAHAVDVPGSYQQVGQQLARSNPARAAELTARIPSTARTEWIRGVAEGYAQTDPQGAATWLAQYRADPVYSAAVGSVAAGLSASDPPAAARLLATATDKSAAMQAAYAVASRWAQLDPQAAAAWAADYDAGVERSVAVPQVAASWAQTDAASARAWAMGLPSGQARDAALSALLAATPTPEPDRALLDAFSTPQSRNQAVANAAMRLAGRDRAAATELIDTYITDESLREQVRRNLERIPPGVIFNASGVPTNETLVR